MPTRSPACLGGTPTFSSLQPIVRPQAPVFGDLAADLEQILRMGALTKGTFLKQFEADAAKVLQVKHAVAVSSATTGLMLTYQGLGIEGEVIVPSFTFMATVSALVWARSTPVFVDVDPQTFNVSPEAVEAAITKNTKAIVAAHTFGAPCNLAALQSIADKHKIPLIIDAAHALGSHYQGEPVTRYAKAHIYSLSPTKLVIAGEGGIVATNDDALAEHIRVGREYGNDGAYNSVFAGLNGRMPEMSALVGKHSLTYVEGAIQRRNEIFKLFKERLSAVSGISFQELQPGDRTSLKDLSLVINQDKFGISRDTLVKALRQENVDTRNYYDPPVHLHTAYRHFPRSGALNSTNYLAKNSVSVPIWSLMDDQVVEGICAAITGIHKHAAQIPPA